MKKLTVLLFLAFCVSTGFAQTKNGTIYSEHELIDKTRQLWKAFQDGDKETYLSFFADSIGLIRNNGEYRKIPKVILALLLLIRRQRMKNMENET